MYLLASSTKQRLQRYLLAVHMASDQLLHGPFHYNNIKTHDSESRGQEEAGRARRTSVLFYR